MRERELEKKTLGRRAGNGGVLANRKKKAMGQRFSRFGLWSKALKALCFNRTVRQDTSSLSGSCC